MKKTECINCGKEMGIRKCKTNAGYLCPDCYTVCCSSFSDIYLIQSATIDEVKSCFSNAGGIATASNGLTVYNPQTWTPTKVVPSYLEIDEENELWLIPDGMLGGKKHPIIHSFDEIAEFELLEDGDSLTKGGLGRAAAGGLLFGGVGAIVGGVTGGKKTKQIINQLQIKITTDNLKLPAIYINLISGKTKSGSMTYKMACKSAEEILSILSIIVNKKGENSQQSTSNNPSVADEIRKYKELLDDGILTQEEFDTKKKELLNI